MIQQGLAPVLITEASILKYQQFINNNDYEGFALWLNESSSQTMTLWLAELQKQMRNSLVEVEPLNQFNNLK